MFAQSGVPVNDSVNVVFSNFINTSDEKSIVLLTNRNIYAAGEKIWFKAYVVNSVDGTLDVATKNLFADIVNEKDSVIEQVVLDNAGFRTDGAFEIPELLPTGFYWIRCYSAGQLSNKKNSIFIQPVLIMNTRLHDESSYLRNFQTRIASSDKLRPVIQFFPERLTGISGLISTGVIQIQNANGSPLSVKGELVRARDSVISSFNTNSFGLARLTFVDDPKEIYTAIFFLNSDTIRYQLPAINSASIQLSVGNQTARTIKAFVTVEDSLPVFTHTTVLAVQRDSLLYAAVGTGSYGITILIDNFPAGVVRLLLFDDKNNVLSERRFYIPPKNSAVTVTPDRKKYAARENVNVHVKVSSPAGKPIMSVLNIAVEDESVQQLSDSIETTSLPPPDGLLFEKWLNRYHEKYTAAEIDELMATRKSASVDTSETSLNNGYDDDNQLENLTGRITNKKGNGIGDRIVTAFARNSRQFFTDVDTTDANGRFSLSIPQGFDSLQLALQVTDKRLVQTTTDSIKIDSFHFPSVSTPFFLKQQFLADNMKALASLRAFHTDALSMFNGERWLKPVTVSTVKKEQLNYDASRRLSSISQILTSDKFRYGGYNALGNAILLVPGVTLAFGEIVIFGPNINFRGHLGQPLIIMDGYEVPPGDLVINFLNSLNPADIDFIEVLRGGEAAQFGLRGGNGVISINTRHGGENTSYRNNNFPTFVPVTYHVSPRFEMPDYSQKEIKNASNPDRRPRFFGMEILLLMRTAKPT